MSKRNSRGRRTVVRRLGALTIVALVSCLLLEGVVRVAASVSPSVQAAVSQPPGVLRGIVREDPDIGYGLVPGYTGAGETQIRVAVNSLGMRDREYDLEGADANRRFVLAAGDSFSFGAGVELPETFLSQLESRLTQLEARWTVAKAGVPGYSLVQSSATVRRHLDRFRPELVIVQVIPQTEERNLYPQRVVGGLLVIPRPGWRYEAIGTDVFDTPFAPGLIATTDRWLRQSSHAYRLARRGVIARTTGEFDEATRARARTIGLTALADLHRDVRARGATLVVVLNNWTQATDDEWHELAALNQTYAAFCRDNGIPAIDMLPVFRSETARVGYLGRSPMDSHWNTAGHRLAAETIARFLQDLVR